MHIIVKTLSHDLLNDAKKEVENKDKLFADLWTVHQQLQEVNKGLGSIPSQGQN